MSFGWRKVVPGPLLVTIHALSLAAMLPKQHRHNRSGQPRSGAKPAHVSITACGSTAVWVLDYGIVFIPKGRSHRHNPPNCFTFNPG